MTNAYITENAPPGNRSRINWYATCLGTYQIWRAFLNRDPVTKQRCSTCEFTHMLNTQEILLSSKSWFASQVTNHEHNNRLHSRKYKNKRKLLRTPAAFWEPTPYLSTPAEFNQSIPPSKKLTDRRTDVALLLCCLLTFVLGAVAGTQLRCALDN